MRKEVGTQLITRKKLDTSILKLYKNGILHKMNKTRGWPCPRTSKKEPRLTNTVIFPCKILSWEVTLTSDITLIKYMYVILSHYICGNLFCRNKIQIQIVCMYVCMDGCMDACKHGWTYMGLEIEFPSFYWWFKFNWALLYSSVTRSLCHKFCLRQLFMH